MSRAAALGGLAILALAVIGASPAPATDLGEVLAQPPSADYTEQSRSATVADGAYDFAGYSDFVNANDPFAPGAALMTVGFTRAFARTWVRPPTGAFVPGSNPRRVLTEVVEEYASTDAARARFEQLREAVLIPSGVLQIDSSIV